MAINSLQLRKDWPIIISSFETHPSNFLLLSAWCMTHLDLISASARRKCLFWNLWNFIVYTKKLSQKWRVPLHRWSRPQQPWPWHVWSSLFAFSDKTSKIKKLVWYTRSSESLVQKSWVSTTAMLYSDRLYLLWPYQERLSSTFSTFTLNPGVQQ